MSKIPEKYSARLENRMTASPESVTRDAQSMARTLSQTFGHGLCVKEVLHRLARLLKITERQAKSLFYGEWEKLPAYVYLRLTEAYRSNLERAARQAEHKAAIYRALSHEWDELCAQDTYACALTASDGEQNMRSVQPLPSSILETASRPSQTGSSAA
ncbi:hypothetical protein [Gluconobacter albidus]|uniref:hypothetical protein n=1 Tax=Gluconobacter albidus TaxID=318683 RepID=UPI001B8BA954|nr:hypothetical protein [Gluconobacter albidus]MBS1029230.1 hypothetical protein [Gluconobacter albidus]